MQSYRFQFFAVLLLGIFTFVACGDDPLDLPELPETPIENAEEQIQGLMMSDSVACYDIGFPITFLFEDGSTQTANDDTELDVIFQADPPPVNVEYPINLIDQATGMTNTANDEDELIELLLICDFDIQYPDSLFVLPQGSCWEVTYPVTFELADSTFLTVNDEGDYLANVDPTNPPVDFAYPLTAVVNGTVTTVNNEWELYGLEDQCDNGGGGGSVDTSIVQLFNCFALPHDSIPACYSYVYPITLTLTSADGNTVSYVVNSDAEWDDLSPDVIATFGFEYPFEVTEVASGEVISIEDEGGAYEAIYNCSGGFGDPLPEIFVFVSAELDSIAGPDCYSFNYPVAVTTNAGEEVTVNEDNDWNPIVFGTGISDFIYPFEVTVTATGETETVESIDDVAALLEACPG